MFLKCAHVTILTVKFDMYIMFVYHSQSWLQKRQDILSTTHVAPLFYGFLANHFINANYMYKKWMICVFINEPTMVYKSMYLDCIQKLLFLNIVGYFILLNQGSLVYK